MSNQNHNSDLETRRMRTFRIADNITKGVEILVGTITDERRIEIISPQYINPEDDILGTFVGNDGEIHTAIKSNTQY